VRLHLLVERGGEESTHDLQIFRVAYHRRNTSWRAGCPAFTTWSNGRPESDKSAKKVFFFP